MPRYAMFLQQKTGHLLLQHELNVEATNGLSEAGKTGRAKGPTTKSRVCCSAVQFYSSVLLNCWVVDRGRINHGLRAMEGWSKTVRSGPDLLPAGRDLTAVCQYVSISGTVRQWSFQAHSWCDLVLHPRSHAPARHSHLGERWWRTLQKTSPQREKRREKGGNPT
jgi:hypothetical protein